MFTNRKDEPLVTIARFADHAQAQNALSALRASGLAPELRDQQLAGLNWFYLPALGGMRLQVPASQQEEAEALLSDDSNLAVADAPGEDEDFLASRRRRIRTLALLALLVILFSWFMPVSCVVT